MSDDTMMDPAAAPMEPAETGAEEMPAEAPVEETAAPEAEAAA